MTHFGFSDVFTLGHRADSSLNEVARAAQNRVGNNVATTFPGIYLDDRNNGLTKIGDDNTIAGVGSLTVDGGTTLDLTGCAPRAA